MKLGFTGTSKGMTDLQATMLEGLLPILESFHHGSCKGSDVEAARLVRKTFKVHKTIIAYPGPDNDPSNEISGVDDIVKPPKTHFARNRDIVNDTDELIATPAEMVEQETGGTWYTIRYAIKMGKLVTIIWPDGGLETIKPGKSPIGKLGEDNIVWNDLPEWNGDSSIGLDELQELVSKTK